MSDSVDKNKYPLRILVEFTTDHLVDERGDEYPVNERYAKGITAVTPTKVSRPKTIDDLTIDNAEYEYTIKKGMTDIVNVPESAIFNPNTEIATNVEVRLREAQKNKEFKDTEGRIGGSKKEKMAYKVIQMSDLAAIEQDEATAIELIKKDKVFPKIDVGAERDKGVSSGTAFLKVKLREAIGTQPPNDKTKRRVYVGHIDYVIKALQDVYTIEDFNKFRRTAMDNGLYEVVKSINPEVYQQVEEGNAVIEAELDTLEAENKILREQKEFEEQKIKDAHPELTNERNGFDWNKVPIDELEHHSLIIDMINDNNRQQNKLHQTKRDLVREFLKEFGYDAGYYSRTSMTHRLYEEIFGKQYVNFLNKSGDAAEKKYDEAEDLESMSEEESSKQIEYFAGDKKRTLASKEAQLAELATITSKRDYDTFFDKYSGSNTYSRGVFHKYGRKGIMYKDCKTEQMVMEWKDTFIHFAKLKIEQLKKEVAEIEHKYRVRESNWDWAFDKKATKAKKKKTELEGDVYPPLSYIKRTGGIKILDSDITTDSIRDKFGFKQVEYGDSLKDIETREHVRHFLGAMADFADILNYDIAQLNEFGGLSIAFASRGVGKASAHYESLRKIINLTRKRGSGAIAHEYMHYLDNIIPSINRSEYTYEDWASEAKYGAWGQKEYKIANDLVKNAIHNIFTYIHERKINGVQNEGKVIEKKMIQSSPKMYGIPKGFINEDGVYYEPTDIDTYFEEFKKSYRGFRYIENVKSKKDYEILGYIVYKFGYKSYELPFETHRSAYYSNSLAMSSDYWSRSWELLARAFETYIYDKLDKAGRANNYLVSGVYFDRPEGIYPQGEEREKLFLLYDILMKTIKTEYNIKDFVAWTDERVDEYIAIKEDKDEEKTESGVIVDADSKELIAEVGEEQPKPTGDVSKAKAKLKELYVILTQEAKYEFGGEINANSDLTNKLETFLLDLQKQ